MRPNKVASHSKKTSVAVVSTEMLPLKTKAVPSIVPRSHLTVMLESSDCAARAMATSVNHMEDLDMAQIRIKKETGGRGTNQTNKQKREPGQ